MRGQASCSSTSVPLAIDGTFLSNERRRRVLKKKRKKIRKLDERGLENRGIRLVTYCSKDRVELLDRENFNFSGNKQYSLKQTHRGAHDNASTNGYGRVNRAIFVVWSHIRSTFQSIYCLFLLLNSEKWYFANWEFPRFSTVNFRPLSLHPFEERLGNSKNDGTSNFPKQLILKNHDELQLSPGENRSVLALSFSLRRSTTPEGVVVLHGSRWELPADPTGQFV